MVNWVKRLRLPYLTLSGRTCYFAGLLSVALWVKFEHRPLLMLGGLMFSCVLTSLVLTWRSVRGLQVTLRRPTVARAFEPSPIEVVVESPLGCAGVLVLDRARPTLGCSVHIERLPPRTSVRERGYETYTRRGAVVAGPLTFSCARPFGLAAAERRYGQRAELLVLPALGQLSGPLRELGWRGKRDEQRPTNRRGGGAETLYLREFQPGDSVRRVHWRASARTGELMVRELEEEKGGLLVLAMGGRGDGTPASRRLLEIAISLTATILNQATKRGRDVLLLLPDSMEAVEIRSADRVQLRQAESLLAMLSNDPGWPDFAMLPDRAAGSATILVHPGMDEPAAPSGVERISAEEVVARGWFRPKGGGRG